MSASLQVMALVACLLAGCHGREPTGPAAGMEHGEEDPASGQGMSAGYTYLRADGNRIVEGWGALPGARVLDMALEGVPAWVVAAPAGRGSVWAAVLEDGRVRAFRVVDGRAGPVSIAPEILPPGTPPLLVVEGGRPRLGNTIGGDASPLTHPALLGDGRWAYLTEGGDLVLAGGQEEERLAVGGLPDARLLVDEQERLLFLAGPTGRYAHGVLGDAIEAEAAVLVETRPVLRRAAELRFPAPLVAEGIAPLWADVDGDGRREILLTLSDEARGARLALYDEEGNLLAMGEPVGRGFRWRHALAVVPFAGGAAEVAAVRTPHIGGVVEFYRRAGAVLQIATQVDGYTSHVLGSRNLDMAAAGDFDGDGEVELLLPSQERTRLGAIERTAFGARVAWSVELGGQLTTNLAAVRQEDGGLVVGAGHRGRVLRLWLP